MKRHYSRSLRLCLLVACATVLWPGARGVVGAEQAPPSLAEVARKEQDRRRAIVAPARVLTEKDVKASPMPDPAAAAAAVPEPAGGGAADGAPAPDPQAADTTDGKGEAHWRGRITEARETLLRNGTLADGLQTQINRLTADFLDRDPSFQRGKIAEDRAKALTELARVRGELDTARQQIVAIEEEARQAGVPPGWLR